jgi:hypothetical protein
LSFIIEISLLASKLSTSVVELFTALTVEIVNKQIIVFYENNITYNLQILLS